MAKIFDLRGEDFLPLPILIIKFARAPNNSFFLLELYRILANFPKLGVIRQRNSYQSMLRKIFDFINSPRYYSGIDLEPYLANYLEDRLGQGALSLNDYLSASLRCLWYLQSSTDELCSSLTTQLRPFCRQVKRVLGVDLRDFPACLEKSIELRRGALDALPLLLVDVMPSTTLLAALKQPFDTEVLGTSRESSRDALNSIHSYLVKHDPEYTGSATHDHDLEDDSDDSLMARPQEILPVMREKNNRKRLLEKLNEKLIH